VPLLFERSVVVMLLEGTSAEVPQWGWRAHWTNVQQRAAERHDETSAMRRWVRCARS